VDLEGAYLRNVVDEGLSAERRLAAALLALRACFFSTNHEGAALAAEQALLLLDAAGSGLDLEAVVREWDSLDDASFATPALELDRSSLGDAETLRALLCRQLGVVHAYCDEPEAALAAFARGLECRLPPERRAQLRMFRGLTLIKGLGNLPQGRAELEDGLKALEGGSGPERSFQEGWLRNVYARAFFEENDLGEALEQEERAMECVNGLHDPLATHLKINLLSSVSVVLEQAGRLSEAIDTWRRFEKVSASWGAGFSKRYLYRLAGLQRVAGDRTAGVRDYGEAYARAWSQGDAFHCQAIAGELGRLHLDGGDRTEAEGWFRRAVEGAWAIGDPLRLAESLAGLTLATGSGGWTESLRLACESTTHLAEAQGFLALLKAGNPAAIQGALPAPRTWLNRPFELVTL
jgi:tetratricopeptide (TPR) repeat protein